MNHSFLLGLCLFFFQFSLYGQKSFKDLKKEDYLKDFDIISEIIVRQHPNPFKFITEKDFIKKRDSLRKQLEKDPNYDTFTLYSPHHLIKDGHLDLANDSEWGTDFNKTSHFFPLPLIVKNGRVFVNYALNKNIPLGSEIIKVNNKTIDELLKEIPSSCDGKIDCIDRKNIYRYLSLMSRKKTHFVIDFKKPRENQIQSITIAHLPVNESDYVTRKETYPFNTLAASYPIYHHMLDDYQTGVLAVNTFNLNEGYAYREFSKFFKEVSERKFKNIIIDLRENKGGAINMIPLLYSFISKSKYFKNYYRYRTKVIDLRYTEYLVNHNNRAFNENDITEANNYMRQRFDKEKSGDYYIGNKRLDDSYIEDYPRNKSYFEGNVYLLTSNNTFSAATYFVSLFQKNKRGIVIGKETGSCANTTMAAFFRSYKLPHTKYKLFVPGIEIFYNDSENSKNTGKDCRGALPDYSVNADQSIDLIRKGIDPEMQYTLDLIKK